MPQPKLPTTQALPIPTEPPIQGEAGVFSTSWYKWFSIVNQLVTQLKANFPNIIEAVENDVSFPEGVIVLYPENRDYPILTNVPYAGTIVSTLSKAFAGTGTATFKKNGSSIGGTANSISTSEQVQTHGVDFDIGDDLSVTVSSASGDLEMAELRMNIVQKFNWLEYSGG